MKREAGYAMLAAVAGITAFGLIGLEILALSRASINVAAARIERAQLCAAADAGFAMAMNNLETADPARHWASNGAPVNLSFGDSALVVSIQDESGKVPINLINSAKMRTLFSALGERGSRLDALVAALQDWKNTDADEQSADPYYASLGIRPRHGGVETTEELIRMRGMDSSLLERLEAVTTTFFGASGAFDPSIASPAATAIMSADDRDRSENLEDASSVDYAVGGGRKTGGAAGRFFTVTVEAREAGGGHVRRVFVIEMTPAGPQPYRVRSVE